MIRDEIKESIRERLREYGIEEHEGKFFSMPANILHTPWIHSRLDNKVERDCSFLNSFLFDLVFDSKHVPLRCMHCYKIDVTLYSVEQVFAMIDLQTRLGLTAKCGFEGDRKDSNKLWGAYFYTDSLEEGKYIFDLVWNKIKDIEIFVNELNLSYYDGDIILRKGCSRFANALGPSDTWKPFDGQELYEEAAREIYGGESLIIRPDKKKRIHNKEELLRSAHRVGDMTYLKLNGGKRYYDPPVTYQ